MPKSPIQVVLDYHVYAEDDKRPCFFCSKPVPVLYEIQNPDGSTCLVCKSHRDFVMKAAKLTRDGHLNGQADALPASNGSRIS